MREDSRQKVNIREFKSSINPIVHDSTVSREAVSPVKAFINHKKMGSQIEFGASFNTAKKPTLEGLGGTGNEAKLEESKFMAVSPQKMNSKKVRDMVGNCPIDHDSSTKHKIISEKRQRAIEGCFGSTLMRGSLTGATRSQQQPERNDKPQAKPIEDIR